MSSISGVGSNSAMMQNMAAMKRPDPAKMADELFAKLDVAGQGYLEKTDLKSALDKTTSPTSGTQASVDDLFSALDGDNDGKVSKQEFSDALQKVSDELDNQMMNMRLGRSGGEAMPPPPPGEGPSLSKEQLTSMASEMASTDSGAASSINQLIDNFEQADSNGDGKVSFNESQAYQQSTAASASSSTDTTSSATASTDTNTNTNDAIMKQIMKLMQAYGISATPTDSAEVSSLFTTIATTA